ncbi:MAG: Mrp/NBP35 family ATP-binding protein [Abditibacteriota bacterium]|nr:Mrp/NBP35 family ATP-binding protein [Abditibacteriota bacterium]
MACNHNCDTCSEKCGKQDFIKQPHAKSKVRRIIGVASGKGGVGKSLVCSLLALQAAASGKRVAIMDADITGPSIPRMFGLTEKAMGSEDGILPVYSRIRNIQIMSLNLLLPDDSQPVVWRGPVIGGAVTQFWTDVIWDDVDFMFIDMPPGTGDVPLTVFQSIPIDGIVVVSSPQELVGMIVEKAVKMADMMQIPVLGLVENMSYVRCPDCGKEISVFGESRIEEAAARRGIPVLARLPIDPEIASLCDKGLVEEVSGEYLDTAGYMLQQVWEGRAK